MITSQSGRRALRSRPALVMLAAVLVASIAPATASAAVPPGEPGAPSVFAIDSNLALDAARVRLSLFVRENPPDSGEPGVACPLATPEIAANAAAAASANAGVDLRLQLDPWTAVTTAEPELRPASAPVGTVAGTPVVTCSSVRPADGALTRLDLFALRLGNGVSFGDALRRYGVEPALPVPSGRLGGQTAGACLATGDTGICIDLWQARNFAIGFTLEGPADVVDPATPDDFLTALVPAALDNLAVVLGPAPACSAATLQADTGQVLDGEPVCNDGWAIANTVPCPPPDTTPPIEGATTTTTTIPDDCPRVDVFHVTPAGWVYDGPSRARCAEDLVGVGMTGVTAQDFVAACNPQASVLGGGAIRPGHTGARVTALQIALVAIGYDLPVDGRYGPLTQAAVVDYQARNGLTIDGIAGAQTRGSLGI